MKDEPAKILDVLPCLFPSIPSGRAVVVEKVIETKRPATTEHEFDVLISQSLLCLTRSFWFLMKTSSGVWPFLLMRGRKPLFLEFFMYYIPKLKDKVILSYICGHVTN